MHSKTRFPQTLLTASLAGLLLQSVLFGEEPVDYPFQPVLFNSVKIEEGFWKPRLETAVKVTIPYAFKQCEERISNFRRAAKLEEGHFRGCPWDDSDVYKVMEGAAYALAETPDPALEKYLEELVGWVAKAQEPDGYIYTARTIEGEKAPSLASHVRWLNEMGGVNGHDSHELYCIGHMIEAAVAHYQSTGRRTFLEVAIKAADLIHKTWGPGADQLKISPGHQEIELALAKLGRATGNTKYIELSQFLLECRGRYRRPEGVKFGFEDAYYANEVPLEQLTVAVGHAVRTAYMLSGMTDVAALRKAAGLEKSTDMIWKDTVGTKLYLHGGIGSGVGMAEGFGNSYELPNHGYNETCAAVANSLWNHRLFLLHGDGKYLDVLERSLYNNVLSGISLSGDRFFYQNPLVSNGAYARKPWFGPPCCPVNLARLIPSVPGMIYAHRGDRILVGLYAAGTGEIGLPAGKVKITQKTNYPWDGRVLLRVEPEKPGNFEMSLRIPGWAQGQPVPGDLYRYMDAKASEAVVKVNGERVPVALEKGFTSIRREWKAGDTIELELPMPIRRVLAHEKVAANEGRVALERGPVVYCVEGADFGGRITQFWFPDDAALTPEFKPDHLRGVMALNGVVPGSYRNPSGAVEVRPTPFTAIPYYAWENRGAGAMAVWLLRTKEKVRAMPAPSLASSSTVSASYCNQTDSLEALNDRELPGSSRDQGIPRFTWWNHRGGREWIQYEFPAATTVSRVKLYWFDDGGGCGVPASWRLLYKDGTGFKPVEQASAYPTQRDQFNEVSFTPVNTSALRIEASLQPGKSGGVLEWVVE